MTLTLKHEPLGCRAALLADFSSLAASIFPARQLARLESSAPISTWKLLPARGVLKLDRCLSEARFAGFAYVLQDGERPVGVAEVVRQPRNRWRLTRVAKGPAREICQAVVRARQHANLRGRYELRWLHAPIHGVEAMWLFQPGRSFMWVLPPAGARLKLRNPCPAERFLERLAGQVLNVPVPQQTATHKAAHAAPD